MARLIRDILIAKGRHHAEVSVEAGHAAGYLRDIILGRSKNPKHGDLVRVLDVLGIDISALSQQGAATANKESGDKPYTKEQVAILSLWNLLSDKGRDLALAEIAKLIVQHPKV